MTFVYGALALLIIYFGSVTAYLSLPIDLTRFSDVVLVCERSQIPLEACKASATQVALQTFVASSLALVIAIGIYWGVRGWGKRESARRAESFSPVVVLTVACTAILLVHYSRYHPIALDGTRILRSDGNLLSLEALLWPLLLQLAFWVQGWRAKLVLAALLSAIAALSPYRNLVVVYVYFGALVPIAANVFFKKSSWTSLSILIGAAVFALVFGSMIVLFQTAARFPVNGLEVGSTSSRVNLLSQAVASRAVTPIFQAVFAEKLSSQGVLPGIEEGVLKKLRLSNHQNLNEYLYGKLYQSSEVGGTTPLLFGEAAANSRMPEFFWIVSSLTSLILVCALTRNFMDLGVLVAVAIWRGSMGGLFDILPAFCLQCGCCIVFAWWARWPLEKWGARMERGQLMRYVVLILLSSIVTAELWSMAQLWFGNVRVVVSEFDVNFQKCALDSAALEAGLIPVLGLKANAHAMAIVRDSRSMQILAKTTRPGAEVSMLEAQIAKSHLNCGTSMWCEGRRPKGEYSANELSILDRKRSGLNIELPGCALTRSDFSPGVWMVKSAPTGIGVLDFVSVGIFLAAIGAFARDLWARGDAAS